MAATLRALAGTHMVLVTAEGTHGPRIAEVRSPAKTGSATSSSSPLRGGRLPLPRLQGRAATDVDPLAEHQEARAWPTERSSWAPFHLVACQAGPLLWSSRVVDDISHEGLQVLLREEGGSRITARIPGSKLASSMERPSGTPMPPIVRSRHIPPLDLRHRQGRNCETQAGRGMIPMRPSACRPRAAASVYISAELAL